MIRVGVVGLGFMGTTHFNCYRSMKGVQVVAVCDVDREKLKAGKSRSGNLKGAPAPLDLSGMEVYQNIDDMLKRETLDAVSIATPTHLHSQYSISALNKGLNVLCEKPMALKLLDCAKMISAANKSGKVLQIGHCIRFWPEYAYASEVIRSGNYGAVRAASFRRLSASPVWSWDNWMLDGKRSGGALMDLHIHDSDYIQYVFGMPKSVRTHGIIGPSGRLDHVSTHYIYNDRPIVVSAEGGTIMKPSFGFEMSFNIVLERATIVYDYTRPVPLKVCRDTGKPIIPKVDKRSGHMLELVHFIKRLRGENVPGVLTPEDSMNSIKLVLAEEQSAKKGKEIRVL